MKIYLEIVEVYMCTTVLFKLGHLVCIFLFLTCSLNIFLVCFFCCFFFSTWTWI